MSTTGIIILAAGASRRMGRPKQRLRYRGRSLLQNAVAAARGSRCRPVVVVLGARAALVHRDLSAAQARGAIEIVVNPQWRIGMSASIRAGLAALGRVQSVVIMPADQPLIGAEAINRLVERWRQDRPLLVASEYGSGTTWGAPAVFDRRLFPELARLHGAAGARRVIRRHAAHAAAVPAPEAEFDVDTPRDYRELVAKDMPDEQITASRLHAAR